MFNMFDVVKTKKDYPEYGLKATYVGAIVDIVNNGEAYTVEFIDEAGNTIEDALYTEFKADELELIENIN